MSLLHIEVFVNQDGGARPVLRKLLRVTLEPPYCEGHVEDSSQSYFEKDANYPEIV